MHMYNPPHPGEILKELYIDPLNLTIVEIAKGIGVSRKSLSELVNGKFGVSPGMAIRLAKAFATTPESWLNLQQQYDLWKEEKKHKRPKIKVFVRHRKAA
ncbi:MAG: addiction module antidote protein, HigA family [Gammaproteobacteria bacterium RIFCSPHIGHO2_12_FULL_37_34]|nr:MAG: addiction module antidote protein, HigA family [Gammaproteobacteria bacterium RIFCSPHIGHO2_12_FULL_37_34]